MSDRIGHKNHDGGVDDWPDFDLFGHAYSLPATTVPLAKGSKEFVVLPIGTNDQQRDDALAALVKARHVKPAEPAKPAEPPAAAETPKP